MSQSQGDVVNLITISKHFQEPGGATASSPEMPTMNDNDPSDLGYLPPIIRRIWKDVRALALA